jgi:hypothetical protein
MDGVESRAVDAVTHTPTFVPTTLQAYLDNQEVSSGVLVEGEPEPEKGAGLIVFIALGVAALWCCLTVCSISYLMKRRAQMREEHDMADLLRQEKIDPMESGATQKVPSSENLSNSESTDGDEEDPSGNGGEVFDPKKKTVVQQKSRVSHSSPTRSKRGSGIDSDSESDGFDPKKKTLAQQRSRVSHSSPTRSKR